MCACTCISPANLSCTRTYKCTHAASCTKFPVATKICKKNKLLLTPGVKRDVSLLEGPSPENSFGFKMSESVLGTSDTTEVQHLTTMSIEIHVQTRGKLRPDPSIDPVLAIFYYLHNDWPLPDSDVNARHGVLAIDLNNCELKTFPKASPVRRGSVANHGKSPAKASPAKGTPVKPSPAKGTPVKASPSKGSPAKGKASSSDLTSASKGTFSEHTGPAKCRGGQYLNHCGISEQLEVTYAISELDLFQKLVELVKSTDPDLLVGFEVEVLSWGYLADRAAVLNINLSNELSRVPNSTSISNGGEVPVKVDVKRGKAGLTLRIAGRILLNTWRIMRHELAIYSYTFESLAFHVLHTRVPHYTFQTLTSWYNEPITISRVVDYYSLRCMGNFQMLEKLNVIGRTSEFARLYGIEFENVLSRGSQYRVESMLLRLAKPSNFIAISPSVQQRARMAAPECLPLILEPESRFYADPVLVLDFQSLYPSMMIAYNYCYSTCLGRVRHLAHREEFTFGTTTLRVPSSTLKKLRDHVTISPNGVVFVKPHVRKGVVPRMVEEILNTRIMVKQSMKLYKDNKSLLRIMDARQLGLKMIINVTYGYTGATYSGRMPCIEIADSIVRKARETLEQAISLVNSTPEWRAKVVYGDTDSMFVLLKGASKEEAFRIGKEIGDRVTGLNPKPVKLKFEKVYMPCILQTKKRYVGFAYESLDQKEPTFDAKGIETVRRDGCPAVAKVLGKSLRLLFSTRDVSVVKSYVQGQCSKLLEGRASIQDYTLAREYRGKSNYRPGACVPALELTKQSLLRDPCSEPRVKERVPYVVVYGSPGLPLIQLIKRPEDILEDATLRLNGVYYITKLILPALGRAFSLIGVDVQQWYTDMPRVFRAEVQQNGKKNTIGQYFATMHCLSCGELTMETMCVKCRREPQASAIRLCAKMSAAERDYHSISELCHNCVGDWSSDHSSACTSLDCPILYLINRANRKRSEACTNAAVLYDTFLAHILEF